MDEFDFMCDAYDISATPISPKKTIEKLRKAGSISHPNVDQTEKELHM
jgi:hypothetical protein